MWKAIKELLNDMKIIHIHSNVAILGQHEVDYPYFCGQYILQLRYTLASKTSIIISLAPPMRRSISRIFGQFHQNIRCSITESLNIMEPIDHVLRLQSFFHAKLN